MNITDLCISKNAQFYVLNKKLNKKTILRAFKNIADERVGNYLINQVREPHTTANGNVVVYSLTAFKIRSEPSFLNNTNIREEKYAFLLIVECDNTLALIKKYIDSPEKLFDDFISDYSYERFCHLYGSNNPEYERVSMKNMSISNAVIRARSLEAKSLNGIIPSNSSSRSVPTSFRMSVGDEVYTLSPSSSRVNHRDKRAVFDELVDWLVATKNELNTTGVTSEFLDNFASPVSLNDILSSGHYVTAIFFDLSEIESKIESGTAILKEINGVHLSSDKIKMLFDLLKNPINVIGNSLKFNGVVFKGTLSFRKSVITIHNALLSSIVVEELNGYEYDIVKYLNKEKPFSAVFDTPKFSYYSRSCFEDKSLLNNINSILNVFDDTRQFNAVNSEKEKPHSQFLTGFPPESLFRAVEDDYCNGYNITLCDDMGDEWADHIAIDSISSIPQISFIHSKYVNRVTHGASAFHEVVAQALKNIGRTQADKEAFKSKYESKWINHYESTLIPRARGITTWDDLDEALNTVNENPNSIKKVVLAAPFLNKSTLRVELMNLQSGLPCRPHYTQLVWLINTFISSCKEYGVQAHILCKP